MSPQSWCVAGNCFSLQKEHENAIKFFQRAAQVNPNFAYAYTLLGHEYITIEELDKARDFHFFVKSISQFFIYFFRHYPVFELRFGSIRGIIMPGMA